MDSTGCQPRPQVHPLYLNSGQNAENGPGDDAKHSTVELYYITQVQLF